MNNIKYLVMDVDGTLTDGKIYMGNGGEVFKAFNIKDGYGIAHILPKAGIIPVIITGRKSQIVKNRCEELGINEIYQGVADKIKQLLKITSDLSQVAYIGDDENDLPCMQKIKEQNGVVGAPKDAIDSVLKIASFIAMHNGGDGAVRDFIDMIALH